MDVYAASCVWFLSCVAPFGGDTTETFLQITVDKLTIKEIESALELIVIDDSSEEDLKMVGGSPMAVDGEPEHGLKRWREEDSDDEDPLVFRHMKRADTRDVLEISKDEEGLGERVNRDAWHEMRVEERPSDPYAEVWEEIWDEELARMFREYDWAQEEAKVLGNEEAGTGGRLEEPKEEFILPEDPNDVVLEPRIDINSVVESNSYVSDEEDGVESIE